MLPYYCAFFQPGARTHAHIEIRPLSLPLIDLSPVERHVKTTVHTLGDLASLGLAWILSLDVLMLFLGLQVAHHLVDVGLGNVSKWRNICEESEWNLDITCCVVLSGTGVILQLMLYLLQGELLGAEDFAPDNATTTDGGCWKLWMRELK
jgi:hypothetical protein